MILLSANKSNDNRIACIDLVICIHYPNQGRKSMIKHRGGGYSFKKIGDVVIDS